MRLSALPSMIAGLSALLLAASSVAQSADYGASVTQPRLQRTAQRLFAKALRDAGIPLRIQSCRLFTQVSNGARAGEITYGAICRFDPAPIGPQELAICTSDASGGLVLYHDSFVATHEWVESFVQKQCR